MLHTLQYTSLYKEKKKLPDSILLDISTTLVSHKKLQENIRSKHKVLLRRDLVKGWIFSY